MGQIPTKSGAKVGQSANLSAEQRDLINKSWATVDGREQEFGFSFFKKLFAAYPEYQNLFGRVKGVPLDELESNKAFVVHATTFMKGLSTLVEQIDDQESADEMLYKIAVRHRPFNLSGSDMQRAADILVAMVEKDGQAEAAVAWKAALDIAIPIIDTYTADA